MSMQIEFTTTITHTITIGDDGIEGVEHAVSIEASESGLPQSAIFATAIGGCRSALAALEETEATR